LIKNGKFKRGEAPLIKNGEFKRGEAPLQKSLFPLPLLKGKGD